MRATPGLFTADDDGRVRCHWCQATPAYRHYHDHEWGFPVDDDRRLFEKLCLEGFQSGLSWLTILNKREHFRRALWIVDSILPRWRTMPASAKRRFTSAAS